MPYEQTTLSKEKQNRPTIIIPEEVHRKLMMYVKNVENEVGGIGKIHKEGNTIYVDDVYLIEQKVTNASTVLSADGLAKFYQERREIDPTDDLSSYKLWWHSHYNFGVFWSGIDDATIDGFDQETEENNYMLSIVGNQKSELRARVDIYHPLRVTMDDLTVIIMEPDNQELEDKVKREIEAKVGKHKVDTIASDNYPWKKKDKEDLDSVDEDWEDDDTIYGISRSTWKGMGPNQQKKWKKRWLKKYGLESESPKDKGSQREVWGSWEDDFGEVHHKLFVIPANATLTRVDKTGQGYYWLKLNRAETDEETIARYNKVYGKN